MRRATGPVVVVLAALALLPGCGSSQGGAHTSPSPPGHRSTDLRIEVRPGDASPARVWRLRCDPAGGTHPHAQQACAALARLGRTRPDPFAPIPSGLMCTQIYGGADVAHVTGTFQGRAVNARYDRTNGCAIARWNRMTAVLGPHRGDMR
jgi:subtilisin inhibitor-like